MCSDTGGGLVSYSSCITSSNCCVQCNQVFYFIANPLMILFYIIYISNDCQIIPMTEAVELSANNLHKQFYRWGRGIVDLLIIYMSWRYPIFQTFPERNFHWHHATTLTALYQIFRQSWQYHSCLPSECNVLMKLLAGAVCSEVGSKWEGQVSR